jgi:hypothetical protein
MDDIGPKEVAIPELNDGASIQEQPNGGTHPERFPGNIECRVLR